MGNTPVTIGLRTDKATYVAGEMLTGRVYVNVSKQAQPAQAIYLKLAGREFALVHHTSSETGQNRHEGSRTHHHYDETTHDFLQVEHPLQTFSSGKLSTGQYEFPFSVCLPATLPTTMRCDHGESYCSVEYTLTATLARPSSSIFSPDPRSEQKITVLAAPPPDVDPQNSALELPMEQVPVTTCCCHNQGTMSLHARLSRTLVKPRDEVSVQFRFQNHSTVKAKKVRVQLVQVIEWNGHGSRRESVRRILDRRDIDARQFPELRRLRNRHLRHFGPDFEQVPSEQDPTWKNSIVQVPADAQDSYNGRAINIRHVLSVQILTKACCTTDPESSTLLQVNHSLPHTTPVSGLAPSSTVTPISNQPLPSTPVYSYNDVVQPSAPPASTQEYSAVSGVEVQATAVVDMDGTPMADAQLLPSDWNAQKAEIVEIPMAQAILVEPVANDDSKPPAIC